MDPESGTSLAKEGPHLSDDDDVEHADTDADAKEAAEALMAMSSTKLEPLDSGSAAASFPSMAPINLVTPQNSWPMISPFMSSTMFGMTAPMSLLPGAFPMAGAIGMRSLPRLSSLMQQAAMSTSETVTPRRQKGVMSAVDSSKKIPCLEDTSEMNLARQEADDDEHARSPGDGTDDADETIVKRETNAIPMMSHVAAAAAAMQMYRSQPFFFPGAPSMFPMSMYGNPHAFAAAAAAATQMLPPFSQIHTHSSDMRTAKARKRKLSDSQSTDSASTSSASSSPSLEEMPLSSMSTAAQEGAAKKRRTAKEKPLVTKRDTWTYDSKMLAQAFDYIMTSGIVEPTVADVEEILIIENENGLKAEVDLSTVFADEKNRLRKERENRSDNTCDGGGSDDSDDEIEFEVVEYTVTGSLVDVDRVIDLFQPRDRGHYTMGLTKKEKSDRRKTQNREAAYRARKRGQFLNELAVQLNAENVALKRWIAQALEREHAMTEELRKLKTL
jgi:hypothetical protein